MNQDVFAGLVLTGTGAYFYSVATRFPVGSHRYPAGLSLLLLSLAMILALKGLRIAKGTSPNRGYPWASLAIIFATAVYILLLPIIGYVLSTACYLFSCFIVTGMRRRALAALLAIVASVGLFCVFAFAFGVRLPRAFSGLF